MTTVRTLEELNDFEKLALIPISYSRIDTYERCQAKYFYKYIVKLEETGPMPYAWLGNIVHGVLEERLSPSKPLRKGDLKEYLEEFEVQREIYDPNGHVTPELIEAGKQCLVDFVDKHAGKKFNIVAKEKEFNLVVGTALVKGYIDRVDINNRSKIIHITDYKGLTLDTPIATPSGWTTMGDLAVGDQVYDMDGKPCNVVVKSDVHYNPCYKIAFDDGSTLVADHEHRWVVDTDGGRKILTTEELAENLINPITQQRHLRIPLTKPIEGVKQQLPIDPWILGMWLGDGKHTSGEITWGDEAVPDVINARGYLVGKRYTKDNTTFTATILGIRGHLKELNVLGDKHIPEKYLRASIEDRMELLSGLMDSDGSWNKQRNQCIFVNTNSRIAHGVCELLASLGIRYSSWKGKGFGFGVETTQYKIAFNPQDWNPFKCSKKHDVKLNPTTKGSRRLIMSVEPIETEPTACIMVDSPSHTFLAGKRMIPTHNTGKNEVAQKNISTNLQLGIYALALKKEYPDYKIYGELYYMRSGRQKGHLFTDDDLRNAEYKFVEAVNKIINTLNYSATSNPRDCYYCPFAKDGTCSAGAKRVR